MTKIQNLYLCRSELNPELRHTITTPQLKICWDRLGVLRGNFGGYRGDWWWNGDIQGKVEVKKVAYAKLVESKDEEEKKNRKGIRWCGRRKR